MDTNTRLKRIADFVRARLYEVYVQREDRAELDRYLSHAEYRWQHTLRVAHYGKAIAETEGADAEVVVAGCLFHDVAWFDTPGGNEHGLLGAKIIRPFLEELDYSPDQVERICYSVAAHADVENPETLEARVVTDADNVDRFGAFRVLYWCLPDIGDYDKLTEKLRKRIERLEIYRAKNPCCTLTGQKLFAEQLDFQIAFFKKFIEEHDSSVLPTL